MEFWKTEINQELLLLDRLIQKIYLTNLPAIQSIGIIPTELFLNSNLACRILTSLIRRIWNGEEIPSSWLNAALCLLYKNKGSKSDPISFRGISLLKSAEKILSIVILKRIKVPLGNDYLILRLVFVATNHVPMQRLFFQDV